MATSASRSVADSRRLPTTLRCRPLLVTVAASVLTSVAAVPFVGAAQIQSHASNAPAAAFCAKMPASTVSSILGSTVTLGEALVQGSILVCLYDGAAGADAIEKETGLAASSIATRQAAEAAHKKLFYASQPKSLPKGTTLSFSPLAGIGSSAFSWKAVIEGSPYVGADAFKGTTGLYVEVRGAAPQSTLKKLEQLDLAA